MGEVQMISGSRVHALRRGSLLFIFVFAASLMVLAILQDYIRSSVNGSGFYVSESFIFSSFWWLFVPLLYLQFRVTFFIKPLPMRITFTALVIGVHLALFPAMVQMLSALFLDHTYAFTGTLQWAIAEHLYHLFILYIFGIVVTAYLQRRAGNDQAKTVVNVQPLSSPVVIASPVGQALKESDKPDTSTARSILIRQGTQQFKVDLQSVVYFSARSPYVAVHSTNGRHLYNGSLRSLITSLDPGQFIRIHKSTVVNLSYVKEFNSRGNGDYDVMFHDGSMVRLSRGYLPSFRKAFAVWHRVAP